MSTSRRKFLKLSALVGGSVGLGLMPGASELFAGSVGNAVKPLRILILGGTGFTGPFQVQYALAEGFGQALHIASSRHICSASALTSFSMQLRRRFYIFSR